MADYIVTRLWNGDTSLGVPEIANEIERLQAERDDWQQEFHKAHSELGLAVDEIERLRAAGDALAAAIRSHDLREDHIKAWEEARRG